MRKWVASFAVASLAMSGCGSDSDVGTDDAGQAGVVSGDQQDGQLQDQIVDPDGEGGDDSSGEGSGDSSDEGSGDSSGEGSGDSSDDSNLDAVALMTDAAKASVGRSVRGTVMVESSLAGAPEQQPVSQFEYDVGGVLSMIVPMGDGDAPEDASSIVELRDVGGSVYMRVPKAEAADLDIDTQGLQGDWVWLVVSGEMFDDMAGGLPIMVLCNMLQITQVGEMNETDDTDRADDRLCHPLEGVAALTQVAENVAVIGDGEMGGVPITRVGFTVPLLGSDDAGLLGAGLFGAGLLGMDDAMGMDDWGEEGDMDEAMGMDEVVGLDDAMGMDDWGEEGDMDDLGAAFIGLLSQMMSSGIAAEAWIDDDKLIRRFSLDMASMFTGGLPDPDTGEMPVAHIVFDFQEFDADISVDAPPAELVVGDLAELVMDNLS